MKRPKNDATLLLFGASRTPAQGRTARATPKPTRDLTSAKRQSKRKQQQQRILAHLIECGSAGATDEELQSALDIHPNSQRPRRIELVKQGLVKPSKKRRPTNAGGKATVWVASTAAEIG